jgi:hypothetical protein
MDHKLVVSFSDGQTDIRARASDVKGSFAAFSKLLLSLIDTADRMTLASYFHVGNVRHRFIGFLSEM